jgi:phage-related minor tail protein
MVFSGSSDGSGDVGSWVGFEHPLTVIVNATAAATGSAVVYRMAGTIAMKLHRRVHAARWC